MRSLTMLLAAGVSLGDRIDTIVPVIIDPDISNGDLTRTVSLMNLYRKIRQHLQFDNRPEKKGYFHVDIDDMNTNFRLHLNNVANMKFADYIAYNRFPSQGQADSNKARKTSSSSSAASSEAPGPQASRSSRKPSVRPSGSTCPTHRPSPMPPSEPSPCCPISV